MYNLPTSTIVSRTIPKKVFIDQLGANIRMKEHFTNDIVKVEWLAKFAPGTLNVADGKDVHEIAVFHVPVKDNNCPNDLFSFIDSMMPRHTIFILSKDDLVSLHLNYKEWIDSTGKTEKSYRITKTYRSHWINSNLLTIDIDGLDMDSIYENLVRQVAGESIISESDDLRRDVEESTQREVLLKEIETLKCKMASEKQPHKKFAFHKQLNILKENLK